MVNVTEHVGDIFAVPQGSVLIREPQRPSIHVWYSHALTTEDACNCQGSWGSGVAAAFREKVRFARSATAAHTTDTHTHKFPTAYDVYHEHCTVPGSMHVKKLILGTCLLIPPQEEDIPKSGRYWIACLMTSLHFGKRVDKPDVILEHTRKSLKELRERLQKAENGIKDLSFKGKLYTVRLNCKAFRTPWLLTRRVLENSGLDVKIINNVDIMDDRERREVLDSMERDGFDVEKVREIRTALGEALDGDEAGEDAKESSVTKKDRKLKRREGKRKSSEADGETESAPAQVEEKAKRRKKKAKASRSESV